MANNSLKISQLIYKVNQEIWRQIKSNKLKVKVIKNKWSYKYNLSKRRNFTQLHKTI